MKKFNFLKVIDAYWRNINPILIYFFTFLSALLSHHLETPRNTPSLVARHILKCCCSYYKFALFTFYSAESKKGSEVKYVRFQIFRETAAIGRQEVISLLASQVLRLLLLFQY